MIINARNKRTSISPENESNLIYINKEFYKEIQNVMTQKCK